MGDVFFTVVSAVVLFAIQYALCTKLQKRKWFPLKLLPLGYVVLVLAAARSIAGSSMHTQPSVTQEFPTGFGLDQSFFDAIALAMYRYAAICLAAILLAWLVYKLRSRKT